MVETFDCNNTNLKRGSKGTKVSLLQTHLKTLGYYTYTNGRYLKIDGDFGKETEKAVIAFQKATQHTPDGWFGQKTCKSLNQMITAKENSTIKITCPNIRLEYNDTGDNVLKLQTILKTAGYYKGVLDGIFKDMTRDAVKAFQKANGLSETGVFDGNSCSKLNKEYQENTPSITTSAKVLSVKQYLDASESNVCIGGVYFRASTITPNTPYRKGNYNHIEMVEGNFTYEGHSQLLAYTLEVYLSWYEYDLIKNELERINDGVCNVYSSELTSASYTVGITLAPEKKSDVKVTFSLTEYTE